MMLLEDSPAVLSLVFLCEGKSYSYEWKEGESPSLIKDGKVTRCWSQTHVPLWDSFWSTTYAESLGDGSRKFLQSGVPSQENPGKASSDRLHFPGVQALGDWTHKVPELLQPFKEGVSGDFPPPLLLSPPHLPDSHMIVVEQLVIEPTQKTLVDNRVSSEEESTDVPFIAGKGPRDQTQASQLAGTLPLHIIPTIRVVKFVSSQKQLELRAGVTWMQEETVFTYRKNLLIRQRRIMKFSMENTNIVCCIVTQLC